MKINRPIVFFDVETTGLSLTEDRIIEICMVKILLDGKRVCYNKRINPQGRQISEGAFSKHGIRAEDLEDCPSFKDVAHEIHDFMVGSDLGGFNCKRFDIPILIEEFLRCGILINIKDFNIVDVYKILAKVEPRTLEATYERFVGKPLENAHNAEADINATIDILDKFFECFKLPGSVKELDDYAFADEESFDLENKLKKKDGTLVFNFGKHKDKTIQQVYDSDRNYYDWLINSSDMTMYTKMIFKNIVNHLKK